MNKPNAAASFLQAADFLLVDGKRVQSESGRRFDVVNPATEQHLASVAEADAIDVDRAVAAGRRAFESGVWHRMPAHERSRILHRFADLMESNVEELALLDSLNNGMPLLRARASVARGATILRWFAGAVTRIYGKSASTSLSMADEFHAYTRQEPIGVAGLITPWNGPIMTFIIKVAPAVAAGCSCVVKPSEVTPLSALRLGELALEAGVPPGVINILPGFGAKAGAAIANHPGIDKISFTGSTAVGKELVRCASGNLKRVTLELGGKSPCVIFDDADMDLAIPAAAMAITANSGQICFAGSRLFVQRKSFDKVVAGIADIMGKLKLGDPLNSETELGPVVSAVQRDRVRGYIESGISEGAELITGGQPIDRAGYFVPPTLFCYTDPKIRIVQEEIFGPVLAVTPFDDLADVVPNANATRYGLGAGIFTTNINTAHALAARITAGNVWINCYSVLDPAMPFGGFKESGWGREMGEWGMDGFLETKAVWTKINA